MSWTQAPPTGPHLRFETAERPGEGAAARTWRRHRPAAYLTIGLLLMLVGLVWAAETATAAWEWATGAAVAELGAGETVEEPSSVGLYLGALMALAGFGMAMVGGVGQGVKIGAKAVDR